MAPDSKTKYERCEVVLAPHEGFQPTEFHSGLFHSKTKRGLRGLTMLERRLLRNKIVLVRSDLSAVACGNKLASNKNLTVAMKTVECVLELGAKVILATHMGEPSYANENFGCTFDNSLFPQLCERFAPTKVHRMSGFGFSRDDVEKKDENVILMDCLNQAEKEWGNDMEQDEFGWWLASLADLYVSDSYITLNISCASSMKVPLYLPSVMGIAVEREVRFLVDYVQENHERVESNKKFAAIVAGHSVNEVFTLIDRLLDNIDILMLGGQMLPMFYMSDDELQNIPEGDEVLRIGQKVAANDVELILPSDVVIRKKFYIKVYKTSERFMRRRPTVADIGPETYSKLEETFTKCNTVLWFGALGTFISQMDNIYISPKTERVAKALANFQTSIVVGEEAAKILDDLELTDKMSFVSKGGTNLLSGRIPPGLEILPNAEMTGTGVGKANFARF